MTAKQAPEGVVGGPTPGPWDARREFGSLCVVDGAGDYIADIHDRETYDENLEVEDEERSFAEASANARLIAAAPDLLEALVQAREALDFDCTGFPRMEERLIHWANKIAGPRGGESFHPDPVILSEICADIAKEVLPQIDAALRKARGQ
jgi:hypothetical protein